MTTAAFTPTAAGTYRWVASYSGDANNAPVAGACNAPGETTVVAVPAAPTQLSHFKCYGARKAGFAPKTVLLRDQFMQTKSVVTKVTQICNPVRKNGGKIVHPRAHLVCYGTHDVGSAHYRPRSVRVTNQFGVRELSVLAPVSLCVPSLKRKGTAPPRGKLLANALDHFRCYGVKPQQTPKVVKLADQFGVTSTKVIEVVRLCNPVRKNEGPAPTRPKAHLVCYRIADAKPLHPPVVRVRNQFGLGLLHVTKPQMLCLPSFKQKLA